MLINSIFITYVDIIKSHIENELIKKDLFALGNLNGVPGSNHLCTLTALLFALELVNNASEQMDKRGKH